METDLYHRPSQGKNAQHKERCVTGKGLPDQIERKQPEKVSKDRHQNARCSDGEGLDGKKDDRHGNNPQYDHRFMGCLLNIMGDLPRYHLVDIAIAFHHLDKRLGCRQNKGDQYKNTNANTDPQAFLGEYSGFFPMCIH